MTATRSRSLVRPPHAASAEPEAEGDDPGLAFAAAASAALRQGAPDAIADETLHEVLTAAVKVFAAKAEQRNGDVAPFADGAVTATETVVAVCAMIRAADLSPFDIAMWFNRLPAGGSGGREKRE
jgi:hypothetical protein